MEYSMEYKKWNNGIFQKNRSTTLNSIFLECGIFQEYSKNLMQQRFLFFFGIWNNPGILKKKKTQQRYLVYFGIWNISKYTQK